MSSGLFCFLFLRTKEFIELYPQHLAEDNSMDYISDDGGVTYNGCHFWTNFEIVDMFDPLSSSSPSRVVRLFAFR